MRTMCSHDRCPRQCEEVDRANNVKEGKHKANEGSIHDRRQGEVQCVRCEKCMPMGLNREMDNDEWYESANTLLRVLVPHSIREMSVGR